MAYKGRWEAEESSWDRRYDTAAVHGNRRGDDDDSEHEGRWQWRDRTRVMEDDGDDDDDGHGSSE